MSEDSPIDSSDKSDFDKSGSDKSGSDKSEASDRARPSGKAEAAGGIGRKAEAERRLAEALRANLRRRKGAKGGSVLDGGPAGLRDAASGIDDDGHWG